MRAKSEGRVAVREAMAEGRLLPAVLAVVLLLGASAGVWLSATQDVDPAEEDEGELPDPGPTPEPEPEPEPLCPEGQIQYLWSCITPISNLSYSPPADVRVGQGVWLEPTYEGDVAKRWNATCGDPLINGSLYLFADDPGAVECMVDGGNPVSTAWTNFTLEVLARPPADLDLGPGAWFLVKGQSFQSTAPTATGEPVEVWAVQPALPQGLTLDAETGVIRGTAYSLLTPTLYTLTASNSGGSAASTFTLSVVDQPPVNVHWGQMDLVLTLDVPMIPKAKQHLGGEPTTFEVAPPLPSGIELNASTGRLSGTPTALQPETPHVVWSNNSGGGAISTLTLTVNDAPVTSILYSRMPLDLVWRNDSIDLVPETQGGTPVTWSISPPLPDGLHFEADGRIHGDPDTLHPWTDHTVTATNTGGSHSVVLEVRVADITPQALSWGSSAMVLEANRTYSFALEGDGSGVESFSIHPPVPGLSISSDGAISGSVEGRASDRHGWTQHTVYANNSGGAFAWNFSLAIHDLEADHADLVSRPVGTVNYGGSVHSVILPFGEWAFPLVMDGSDRPIVSAGHVEQGRIWGGGHGAEVSSGATGAKLNLALNAFDWLCDGRQRVGLSPGYQGWEDKLLAEGYTVVLDAEPADLSNVDCWLAPFWNDFSDAENAQIETWTRAGGGLMMSGHAWWWSYSNPDVPHNYPGNKIARTTGLMVSATTSSGDMSAPAEPWGPHHRLHGALPLLQAHYAGTLMLQGDDADAVAGAVNLCVSILPIDFREFWGAVWALSNQTGMIHIDSQNTFTLNADEIDDLMLNVQEKLMLRLPADQLFAHPSSASFPGSVNATAPRLTRTVTIDGDFAGLPSQFGYANADAHGRMSTGMYAAPGEVVNVTVPPEMVDQNAYVLIGGHSDNLWGKDTLLRHPVIIRNYLIDNTSMQVANAFGGAIYIQIAKGSTLGPQNVTISGAVEMPWYRHGITDVHDWQMVLRHAPAPTAELQSGQFILTVPSANIRALDDPDHAMDFWDEALHMEHNLSGYTPWPRVERAQFDVQISAGWMHSGYPFMAHLASVDGVVNGTYMYENGDWGMFHELGHNHQWMSSTLPGNTETTCNLYSMKLMSDLVGVTGHGAMSPSSREQRTESHFQNGAPLSAWSVWTALETHMMVQEAFGWDPITEALDQYYWGNITEPVGDSAEFNEWAVQTSLSTGHNLMPYHAAWNFPLTQTSWDAVDHLPVWNTDPLRGWVHEYDILTRNHTAANISDNAADLEWNVYDNGTNSTMTVCWGWLDGGNSTLTWANCATKGTPTVGDEQHHVNGLTTGVNYKWRVMAENANGQTWSDLSSFTAS